MSEPFRALFSGKTVMVTGHTGFKGSWLALWLDYLGANVVGVSLNPPTEPNHFTSCGMKERVADLRADIRDYDRLTAILGAHQPEIVFHLAAQPIVRHAFANPRETFEINVMGTVNLLEAARKCDMVRAVVVATSDKCYRNVGWEWPYRETDPLGGNEPYAGSKACAELVVEVYQQERFQAYAAAPRRISVASGRAGNVIGGGDWAADRLVPDIARAIAAGRQITLRNPEATRPWQHVLDCLSGYLHLAARLCTEPGRFEEAWNFGPNGAEALSAADVVAEFLARWPDHATELVIERDPPGKEAQALRVDSSKAAHRLGWRPCWPISDALDATVAWYRDFANAPDADMHALSVAQIEAFTRAARAAGLPWAAA